MPDHIPTEHDHTSAFEKIRQVNAAGNEYWLSRDLAGVLGYVQYRNFEAVVAKAKQACFNSGQRLDDHFADISKMVSIGSKTERPIADTLLSRYACYLIVQNADPSKPIVAIGQTYFAIQTRRQELADHGLPSEDDLRLQLRDEMKRHNKQLAATAKKVGVVRLDMDFSDRWAVEDTFRNVKQFLGAEQPQSWKDIAPERAGAFSYLAYGAVWLVRIEREGEKTAVIQREWYGEKDCVSFLDALADVRQQLWGERIIAMSSSRSDLAIIQELLVNALAWAA